MRYLAERVGLRLEYELIERVDSSGFDIAAEVSRLISQGYSGINVTHPFKQRLLNLVDRDFSSAESFIGAYNSLRFDDGIILGANTDFSGFKQGYVHHFGQCEPGAVLVCGAGGAGRAIARGLAELGASELLIYDLIAEQALRLADDLNQAGYRARAVAPDNLVASMGMVDGLINATALGMHHHPGSAFPLDAIGGQRWAFDAIYTPLETRFLGQARREGLEVVSGFNLWIFQGLDTFSFLTGVEVAPDPEILDQALRWLD